MLMDDAGMPLRRYVTLACWLVACGMAIVVALIPVTFDTMHVTDTTFLAQVGNWVRQGATPGVDFDHFYGGMHETFIAYALGLSGGTIKALDYALVIQFVLISAALLALGWRRLDPLLVAIMALLCAVIIFARFPFEMSPFVHRIHSGHSFAYNRFGTALTLICAVVVLVPSKSRTAELVGGAIAGIAVIAAVLAKSTFFPIALACVLGFFIMRRWGVLAVFVLTAIVLGFLMDPTGGRTWGTLTYSMASSGTGATEGWLLGKAVRLIFTQQLAVLIFAVLILLALGLRTKHVVACVACAIVLVGAFWASSVTMGPASLLGHQAAPVLGGVALLLVPLFRGHASAFAASVLSAVLVLGFVLPQGFNFAASTAVALRNVNNVAVQDGPMSGYFAQELWRREAKDPRNAMRHFPETAVQVTAARLASGAGNDASTDYVLLADAINLVRPLPDLPSSGLVSDSRLGLGFALGTPRVDGFPVWLRPGSPEMAPDMMPLQNAALVLLREVAPTPYTDTLRSHMGDDFVVCRRSVLWALYVRSADFAKFCTGS